MADDPVFKRLRGLQNNVTLVGTDDEVKTQLSLLLGLSQITESQQKGLDIDFVKFINLFEDGFGAGFLAKQNKGLNPKYWGQAQKSRPKIRVLYETNAQSEGSWTNQGYYLVELQPDRTNEEESYLLFGTPAQLVQQCMYWMNMHRKLANLDIGSSGLYTIPCDQLEESVETRPQLIIKFQESVTDARKNKRSRWPLIAIHYIRLYQDFSSKSEVEKIAKKVYSIFAKPVFKFDKGKIKYSYRDKSKGYSFIVACPGEAEARNLITKLLACNDEIPNWFRLTESKSKKVTEPLGSVRINGETYSRPQYRRTGKVRFISAELHVHGLKSNIHLVDLGGQSRNPILKT